MFEDYEVFDVGSAGEEIEWLAGGDAVVAEKGRDVAGLSDGVAGEVDDGGGFS